MKRERVRALSADVDWSALDHAYGFATDVPHVFESLVCGSPAEQKHAAWQLWGNVFHQGSRYGASPAALRLAAALAREPDAARRSTLLDLTVGLLLGYEDGYIATGYRWSNEGPPGGLLEDLQRTFDACAPIFVELCHDTNVAVRAGAARCLGWTASVPELAIRRLTTRLGRETEPVVIATVLFALSLLGEGEQAERMLGDERELVRTYAGIALVRLHGADAPSAAKAQALEAATTQRRDAVPFLHGEIAELAGAVTAEIDGAQNDPAVVHALCHALRNASLGQALPLAQLLLRAAFGVPHSGSELGPLQRAAVTALVETDAAWVVLNIEDALGAAGLPKQRDALSEGDCDHGDARLRRLHDECAASWDRGGALRCRSGRDDRLESRARTVSRGGQRARDSRRSPRRRRALHARGAGAPERACCVRALRSSAPPEWHPEIALVGASPAIRMITGDGAGRVALLGTFAVPNGARSALNVGVFDRAPYP